MPTVQILGESNLELFVQQPLVQLDSKIAASSIGGGSVTSFSAGNLAPLFTSNVANPTTTPALTFSLTNAAQNTVLIGPVSGGAGAPTYRLLDVADLPAGLGTVTSVNVAGGTTGLSFSGGPITSSGTITLAGTLEADNGGTGQSVYAIGDLLYASTTTALSRLADVAVGSYLRSGGVNTAPLWSTLVLPNTATAQRIVYATGTNIYGESANLTFSGSLLNLAGFMGINNSSPTSTSITATTSANIGANSVALFGQVTGNITTRTTNGDNVFQFRANNGLTTGAQNQIIQAFANTNAYTVNHTGTTLYGFRHNPTLGGSQTPLHLGLAIESGQALIGGTTITAGSVLLDLQSTTQGLLLPRVTNIGTGSISSPVNGMVAYDVATNKFNFRENGAWIQLGNVMGPASSTDNAVVRFDSTTGRLVQNSIVTISDDGDIAIIGATDPLISSTDTLRIHTTSEDLELDANGGDILLRSTGDPTKSIVASSKIRLPGFAVASLPAGTQGDTAFVTDASSDVRLTTVTGGGANVVQVFYDGTNWRIA